MLVGSVAFPLPRPNMISKISSFVHGEIKKEPEEGGGKKSSNDL